MSDLISGIGSWFSMTWQLFTDTTVPGLGVSVATLSLAVLIIGAAFSILGIILNRNFSGSASYGSSGNKRIKVSKERRGDVR